MPRPPVTACLLAVFLLLAAGVPAAPADDNADDDCAGPFCAVCTFRDRLGSLYEDDDARFIQRFGLKGSFDVQYAAGDSTAGTYTSRDLPSDNRIGPVDLRRLRLGATADFLGEFTLDFQANMQASLDRPYSDIYQLWLEWNRFEAFEPMVGIIRIPFTREFSIPDSQIVTIERSLLTEQVLPDSQTGVQVGGDVGPVGYVVGVYAGDDADEFSRFDAGAGVLSKVTYDVGEHLDRFDVLQFGVDYLLSTSPDNDGLAPYRHTLAAHHELEVGRFNLLAEGIAARGLSGTADVAGITLIPSYFVVDERVQAVMRYQFAYGDGPDALTLRQRYAGLAPDLDEGGRGRRYHAVYAGVNYYLCHPDVKFMLGVEAHDLGGGPGDHVTGVSGILAFRFAW